VNSNSKNRIFGIPNRYYVLLFLILLVLAQIFFPPVRPHVQLPAEPILHYPVFQGAVTGQFFWTNTLTAMVIADILLVLMALTVRRVVSKGEMVPKGITGAVEAILEMIHNLTETTAGKWTKAIFPFFATITLLVLVVNWMELIPGVDSIGFLEQPRPGELGFPIKPVTSNIYTLYQPKGAVQTIQAGDRYTLVPFVRVLSTDLNFTVALALISVVMTQVIGLRALGPSYLTKYFNVKTLFSRPIFGVIDFGVGLLEIISEFSKILSFSFRLFGNIFAGSVLLFVMGTLLPILQSPFLLLEFFVGLIQAVVFGMLTMVFMSLATIGHGDHEEGHAS